MNYQKQYIVGIVAMVSAMILIPASDILVKVIADELSSFQITWKKFIFQAIVAFPLIFFHQLSSSRRNRHKIKHFSTLKKNGLLNFYRGFAHAMANLFFYSSLIWLHVSEALAIFFIEPFFVIILGVLFLKEKIRLQHIVAIVGGFTGVIVITGPQFQEIGFPVFLPLLAAFSFSIYIVITKRIKIDSYAAHMHFSYSLMGAFSLSIILLIIFIYDESILDLQMPNFKQWIILLAIGGIASASHFLIQQAIRRLQASDLAPLQYLEIVSASLLGYLIFNHIPGFFTWLGIFIIIISSMYLLHQEGKNIKKYTEATR